MLYRHYPAKPHTVFGWVALFGIGLPAWALLEWLGDLVSQIKWLDRLSSPTRIALGVPAGLLGMGLCAVILWLEGRIIERL
jgi:hypothetical protein